MGDTNNIEYQNVNESLIYDRKIVDSVDELDLDLKKVLEWTPENGKVLECGCHSGYLSYWLKNQGCLVTGVDIDENALNKAKEHLSETHYKSIDDANFWNNDLKDQQYDTITFLHILEHIISPWKTLSNAVEKLAPGGSIIVTLPNVCSAKTRFSIMRGRFEYEDSGVMDRTHLRFFNKKTAMAMIEQCGLEIEEYYCPEKSNPVKAFLDELPLLYRIGRLLKNKHKNYRLFSDNLTDVVMSFKCKKAN